MFCTRLLNRPKNDIRNSKGKDGGNTSKQVFQSYFYLCITGGTPSSFDLCKDTVTNKEGLQREYNNSKYFSRNPTAPSWGYLEVLRASDLNVLSFYYRCLSLKGFWSFSPPPFLLRRQGAKTEISWTKGQFILWTVCELEAKHASVCLFFLFFFLFFF